jgi:hypothetical protein
MALAPLFNQKYPFSTTLSPLPMKNHYVCRFNQALYVLICWLSLSAGTQAQPGTTWISRTSAADNQWTSVTYGNGLFVAVAFNGTGNRVMTSPDGITWTIRTSAADNQWISVTYGNGLFVAVAYTGTGNRVMTSPDGITWTIRTSAADNQWTSVTYGNGLFVAVATSGTGNGVMTSPDGITWTIRTSAADNQWTSVTYGNGLFVAVATSGTGNGVMTSPDGITWTSRTSAADNPWRSVTYGNGLFVAVAFTGTGNRVMTSPDGITWTIRTSAADNQWISVTYGNGLFVAVAGTGTGNRVMTSPDGITWTIRTSAADNQWTFVTYGNGRFVAVSQSGTGNRVMTSEATPLPVSLVSFTAQPQPDHTVRLNWTTALETNNKGFLIDRSKDLISFETVGQASELAPTSEALKHYTLTDLTPYAGTSYYRLTQTDLSGKATVYPAVSVVLKAEGYGVFPNPVASQAGFSLRLDEPNTATVSLVNAQGKVLPFQKTGIQSGNLLLKPSGVLPTGVYILSVQERAQTRHHRIVVQ